MNAHPTFEQVVQLLRMPTIKPVFPMFIAFRIKEALLRNDGGVVLPNRDYPGGMVGEVETIGDCKYEMIVHVANGTRCRITVEPISDTPATTDSTFTDEEHPEAIVA